MKRISVLIVLILGLLFFLPVGALAGPALDRVLQRGELVVGTSGEQPPLIAKAKDGRIIGLDADLSRLMAAKMGVQVRYDVMPFSQLIPALEAGKVDMIISGMTMTPRRNLKIVFVGPYYISGKGVLTKLKTIASMETAEDMNSADTTLVALKGSTSQAFVEKAIPKAKLLTTDTLDQALGFLFNDKAQALVADYPYCAVSAFRYPDKGLVAGEVRLTVEPLGIGLPADDLLFLNWVDNFVNTLEWSGDLKRLTERWFKDTSWVKDLR